MRVVPILFSGIVNARNILRLPYVYAYLYVYVFLMLVIIMNGFLSTYEFIDTD